MICWRPFAGVTWNVTEVQSEHCCSPIMWLCFIKQELRAVEERGPQLRSQDPTRSQENPTRNNLKKQSASLSLSQIFWWIRSRVSPSFCVASSFLPHLSHGLLLSAYPQSPSALLMSGSPLTSLHWTHHTWPEETHVGLWSRRQRSLNTHINTNNQSKGSPVSWCVLQSVLLIWSESVSVCSDGSLELVFSLHCSLNLSVTDECFAAALSFCRDVNLRLMLTDSRLIPHELLPFGASASLRPHLKLSNVSRHEVQLKFLTRAKEDPGGWRETSQLKLQHEKKTFKFELINFDCRAQITTEDLISVIASHQLFKLLRPQLVRFINTC